LHLFIVFFLKQTKKTFFSIEQSKSNHYDFTNLYKIFLLKQQIYKYYFKLLLKLRFSISYEYILKIMSCISNASIIIQFQNHQNPFP